MDNKIQVLYVDDDKDILRLAKRFLERQGDFHVTTLSSAADAINLLKIHFFDIIVSDFKMPDMNGLEFLHYLKSEGNITPFILFTAREREEVIIEALNAGVDFYLHKGGEPLEDFEELGRHIVNLVFQKRNEIKLIEEQKSIANILEYLPDAMFATNNEGVVIAWNRAMEGLTGVKKGEIIGKGDYAYALPLYGYRRKILLDLVLTEDEDLASEYPFLQKSGHTISAEVFTPAVHEGMGAYMWITGTPLFDAKGNKVGAIESLRDITDRKKVENELVRKNVEIQESREKYQALYMNMTEGAALHELIINDRGISEDYRIIDINPAFEKNLGLTRDQVIGKTGREAYHVADPPYLDVYTKVALTGEPVHFEVYFQPLDKYLSISAYCPYKGSFATIVVDITERTLFEEKLRKSENRLNEAQHLALIGSWEHDLTTNRLEWSDVIYQIFEIDPSTFGFSYDAFLKTVYPDDHDIVNQTYISSMHSRDQYTIEYRILIPDGRIKHVLERGETRYDPLGKPLSSFGTIQDITSQKMAETSLRETNEYLESLISSANVPIIVWNSSFKITRLNHACENLIGSTAEEVIGMSLDLLFPPDQAEKTLDLLRSTLEGVRWETTEIDIMHRDGSIRTILWNSSTIYSPDGGTPIATIAQGHDVTRERRLERERDIALSQIKHNLAYLAILNDEIRNPLNIIMAYSDMLADHQVVEHIAVQVQRIDMMVSQLDKRWSESEKILDYLRKHHQVSFNIKDHDAYLNETDSDDSIIKESGSEKIQNRALLSQEIQAELYSILDTLDSLVYIADMDTYDLIYMNKWGRILFGSFTGKKCYQYLNPGNDVPCPFCVNSILRSHYSETGSIYIHRGEYKNLMNGRWYSCLDRIIRWTDGRRVKFGISTDTSASKEMEKALNQEKSVITYAESVFHMGTWRHSFETQKTSWSEGMYKIFGLGSNPVQMGEGEIFRAMIHPEDRDTVICVLNQINADKIPRSIDYRILRSNGSIAWLHTEGRREYDESGKVVAVSGFSQDITDKRRISEELLDTRQKLESIILGSQLGSWEWSLRTGEATFNERWAEILGYSVPDIHPVNADTWRNLIHPDDLDAVFNQLNKLYSGDLRYFESEFRMKHKFGHNIWVYCLASVISRSDDHQADVVFGITRDITEEKTADIRLRESEMRYKYISETTTDFVFSCSRKGLDPFSIDWITGAVESITGYSLEEILAMGCWRSIVHPEDQAVFDKTVIDLSPGSSGRDSLRIIRKDGAVRWLIVNATHVFHEDPGQPDNVFGGCRDVTDHRKADDELRIVQEKYTKAFLSCPDAIIISDLETGILIEINDVTSLYYGYDRDEVIGKSSLELGIWIDDQDRGDFIRKVTEEGRQTWYEANHRRKSGEVFPVAISADLILLEGKTCLICTIRDISRQKSMEKRIRESEERYHNLVHDLPGYILVHRDGKIIFVNNTGAMTMGYTPEDVIGTDLCQYLAPESRNLADEMIRQRAMGIAIPPNELTVVTKNGQHIITEVKSVQIQYDGVPAVLSVLTDITERKRILDDLRESENRVRLIMNSMQIGVIIVDAATHRIVDMNQKASGMVGKSREDIIGKICHQVVCPAERGRCPLTDLSLSIDSSECVLLTADGREKPVLKTVIQTEMEGKEVLIESLVDISDRKQIEEALRKSEIKYRQLVENANDSIIVAQNGFMTLVNPRMIELTGYSSEELRTVPFTEFIHPDDRQMVMDMHLKRINGVPLPSRYSFRVIRKNGDVIWVDISTVLIDWDGDPATLNFLVDVSDKKQAEEALRESNKKLRLLTSLTRHDIFNQLSTIELLQTMALESQDLTKIHEYISHAQMAGNRIETIIGFTREYEDFGIVSSGWESVYPLIESAKHEVSLGDIRVYNLVSPDLQIYTDPIIRKVFTTLLENAVRHGGMLSRVTFTSGILVQGLIITCEDDGTGIPDDEKHMIFEHGFGSHTGIGLFLAKEMLSITGLSIEERGVHGQGARFQILVPYGKFRNKV